MTSFHRADWTDFYGKVSEAIPNNAPEPRGKEIKLHMYVDSDHANDKIRMRSSTGFCIFIYYGMCDVAHKTLSTS